MKQYISWSGGKDSTASVILEHIHGLPKSDIVFSEVMFDNKRNISGEDPEHIRWIYDTAIPILEDWGYSVYVVRDERDYVTLFNKVITRSKTPSRNGLIWGFPMAGRCYVNSRCKIPPIKKFVKANGYDSCVQGIAINEPKRLERMHKDINARSYLEEYCFTEAMAHELCREYNLLSPIYTLCHNSGGGEVDVGSVRTRT